MSLFSLYNNYATFVFFFFFLISTNYWNDDDCCCCCSFMVCNAFSVVSRSSPALYQGITIHTIPSSTMPSTRTATKTNTKTNRRRKLKTMGLLESKTTTTTTKHVSSLFMSNHPDDGFSSSEETRNSMEDNNNNNNNNPEMINQDNYQENDITITNDEQKQNEEETTTTTTTTTTEQQEQQSTKVQDTTTTTTTTDQNEQEQEQQQQQEEKVEEDPEIKALKQDIQQYENTLKEKRRTLMNLNDKVDEYTKTGYARKVAEMENMRRARSMLASSNKQGAIASTLAQFLPIYDELQTLNRNNENDNFGKQYGALFTSMQQAFHDMGVIEYSISPGDEIDNSRMIIIESQPSDDVPANTVLQCLSNGLELQGNIVRMAQVVSSLGSNEDLTEDDDTTMTTTTRTTTEEQGMNDIPSEENSEATDGGASSSETE